eukprot:13175920-Ditylum_brightwellii.AAC.1
MHKNGYDVHFKRVQSSLYYHGMKDQGQNFFVTMVKENKQMFNCQQLQKVPLVYKLYRQIEQATLA